MDGEVWAFFYGSFMNPDVMKRVGHTPRQWEVACVTGFEFRIAPRANLVRAEGRTVFGIATPMPRVTLDAMYATQSHGETYLPEALMAVTANGTWRPVLCFIAGAMAPGAVDSNYVRMILDPARQYGFPDWYVRHIESFLPSQS